MDIDHTEHNRQVDLMEEHRLKTGEHIDPVTGAKLPKDAKGKQMVLLRDPNRQQRRELKRWRKKVS